jgi:hypothetical protein
MVGTPFKTGDKTMPREVLLTINGCDILLPVTEETTTQEVLAIAEARGATNIMLTGLWEATDEDMEVFDAYEFAPCTWASFCKESQDRMMDMLAEEDYARREFASMQGMGMGIGAYNDAMGW